MEKKNFKAYFKGEKRGVYKIRENLATVSGEETQIVGSVTVGSGAEPGCGRPVSRIPCLLATHGCCHVNNLAGRFLIGVNYMDIFKFSVLNFTFYSFHVSLGLSVGRSKISGSSYRSRLSHESHTKRSRAFLSPQVKHDNCAFLFSQ